MLCSFQEHSRPRSELQLIAAFLFLENSIHQEKGPRLRCFLYAGHGPSA